MRVVAVRLVADELDDLLDARVEVGFLRPGSKQKIQAALDRSLEGLGQWFNEERDVYRDYGEKIGGALPAKIVRVWLIAVSLFQRTEGKCQYADISFVTDDGVMPVL